MADNVVGTIKGQTIKDQVVADLRKARTESAKAKIKTLTDEYITLKKTLDLKQQEIEKVYADHEEDLKYYE